MTEQNIPTSVVLNRAADLIQERGWVVGSTGWPVGLNEDRGLCLEGGLMAALGESFNSVLLAEFYTCPGYVAVQNYLELTPGLRPTSIPVNPLYRWNDRARTAEQVIEVLRAAAAIEQARESDVAPLATTQREVSA